MKTPDYLTYERYKKNKTKEGSKNKVTLGVTTFFITLLLFTVVAKSLSPNVDVTIGGDSGTDAKETGLGVKKFIDERLKMIQNDDNSAGVSTPQEDKKAVGYNDASFNKFSQELEEKVDLPTKKGKTPSVSPDGEDVSTQTHTAPRPTSKDLSTPFVSAKTVKVLVGRYSTLEQAKVAQEILLDSGLNITPFVKDMGGSYTLQVGSYSSKAKADGLATELQRNNFPARVVQE